MEKLTEINTFGHCHISIKRQLKLHLYSQFDGNYQTINHSSFPPIFRYEK